MLYKYYNIISLFSSATAELLNNCFASSKYNCFSSSGQKCVSNNFLTLADFANIAASYAVYAYDYYYYVSSKNYFRKLVNQHLYKTLLIFQN